MLILEEQVISVKMGHNVGGYDMLHNLATNISQGNGFSAWILALFIYRCEVGIFPVREDCSHAREALKMSVRMGAISLWSSFNQGLLPYQD